MSKFLKVVFISFLATSIVSCYGERLLLKIALWQLRGLINFSLIDFIRDISSVKKVDPYAAKKAKLRSCACLCSSERAFCEKRRPRIAMALEQLVGLPIHNEHIPTIGLCFSGGGYRAMIGTLAFLSASRKYGILDTVTYISALSGSTWALSTWLGHDLDFDNLIALTKSQISGSLLEGVDRRLLIENGIWKLFYGQKLSLVGIWGSIIANILFNDFEKNYIGAMPKRIMRGKMPKLSQFRFKIEDGSYPMPLFTAVSVSKGYEWLEFNPYEVGFLKQNKYIPSWSFGRKFVKGESVDFSPEHGIDYLMGIWGSAFTASLGEILGHCFDRKFLGEVAGIEEKNPGYHLNTIPATLKSEFLKLRLSPAKIKSLEIDNENEFLTLVDAGIDFNLPVPPLLKKERAIDVIIICDLSSNADTAAELRSAQEYALKNSLKFPEIPTTFVNDSIISVFEDENPEVPIVIYMPMIKNMSYSSTFDPKSLVQRGGYCSTFNLQYNPQQFDELFGFVVHNFKQSAETIQQAIQRAVDRKRNNDSA